MEVLINLLQKLFGASSVKLEKRDYTFTVKCKRCGETIQGRVDLNNDLSIEYEEGGDVFYARKVLIGENKCFQRVEVQFKFSSDKTLVDKDITGGEFSV